MNIHRAFLAAATTALGFLGVIAQPAMAQEKELNLFAWSEYVPQAVIDGFTKETGIKVNYETYASNEEMVAKLRSGSAKYDLLQPSEYTVQALIKDKMLAELDWSKIPNIKNIAPEYLHLAYDPQQKYAVPWMVGSVGIVVNTDKVKDPIKGYADVFQEKYKNRIVVVDDSREITSWAMDVMGLDINKITDESLAKVQPMLETWLPLIKVYDSDSPKTALINGDVDLGIVWSGEAALCYQADKKFKYVLPAEGAHQFIDNLCVPANAPHKDAAMQFINYILRPEVSKLISDDFPYTNPNLEARKLLTPEQLANPASYPTNMPKMEIFQDIGRTASKIDELVTALKGG